MAARWDQDTILAALRRWDEEVGGAPSAADWERRRAHPHWLRHPGRFPSRNTVERACGGWLAGVRMAGLEPHPVGRAGHLSDVERRRREREKLKAEQAALRAREREVERELKKLGRAA